MLVDTHRSPIDILTQKTDFDQTAAKVLPPGDIKITAHSASGAKLLRKYADG